MPQQRGCDIVKALLETQKIERRMPQVCAAVGLKSEGGTREGPIQRKG